VRFIVKNTHVLYRSPNMSIANKPLFWPFSSLLIQYLIKQNAQSMTNNHLSQCASYIFWDLYGHHQGDMWTDNKVRELATLCLLWQHWTKTLVGFDGVDISPFHSCVVVVVVDVWQSPSEWHLLLSVCVLVCRRENVGAWIRANNKH